MNLVKFKFEYSFIVPIHFSRAPKHPITSQESGDMEARSLFGPFDVFKKPTCARIRVFGIGLEKYCLYFVNVLSRHGDCVFVVFGKIFGVLSKTKTQSFVLLFFLNIWLSTVFALSHVTR